MFIALEGIDASGKHSQTERLKKYFSDAHLTAVKFSLPDYETKTGQLIQKYLTNDINVVSDAGVDGVYMFQCCQIVNRLEALPRALWDNTIREKMIFIADRYNASAYAYGLAYGVDLSWLLKVHENLPQPDINILLDIPVEESFKRRPNRRDNYERDAKKLSKVRESYLEIFRSLGESYVVIDANANEDEVFKSIVSVLREKNFG